MNRTMRSGVQHRPQTRLEGTMIEKAMYKEVYGKMMTLWIGQQTEAVNTRDMIGHGAEINSHYETSGIWPCETSNEPTAAVCTHALKIKQLRRSHMCDDMKWNRTTGDARRRLRLLFITERNVERDATNLQISYFIAGVYCNKTKYDAVQLLQVVLF